MYQPGFGLPFSTAQSSEGTVGTGTAPSVNTDSAIIGQYTDYVNISDYALETAIDPAMENLEREETYRLSGTINTLIKTQFDNLNTIDSSTLTQKISGSVLVRTDLTGMTQELRQRSVKPYDIGANNFCGTVTPLSIGDVLNDSANNSLTDIYKHTSVGLDRLLELPGGDGKDHVAPVLLFGGMTFYETPFVTENTNYKSGGLTSYRTYLAGHRRSSGFPWESRRTRRSETANGPT